MFYQFISNLCVFIVLFLIIIKINDYLNYRKTLINMIKLTEHKPITNLDFTTHVVILVLKLDFITVAINNITDQMIVDLLEDGDFYDWLKHVAKNNGIGEHIEYYKNNETYGDVGVTFRVSMS